MSSQTLPLESTTFTRPSRRTSTLSWSVPLAIVVSETVSESQPLPFSLFSQ